MYTAAEAFEIACQYYRGGQLAPAQQMFHNVLELAPDHAEAWHLLGGIALQTGAPDQALAWFRKACACNPANACYWNDLGVVCISTGQFRDGAAALERALGLRLDYPEAYNNLGIACQQLGQLGRAVECFEQAIRLRPTDAEAYSNLANALRGQGQAEVAAAACEQALQLQPNNADAANNLGIALQELGKVEEAADCYRQALRLRPHFANAANNLGTALKEQGLLHEAITQYRETLNLAPTHSLAYYNLSQFAADERYQFTPEEQHRLEVLVAGGQGTLLEQSIWGFALAAVQDREGSHEEAFQGYRQANDLRRRHLRAINLGFESAKFVAQVDQVIATFDESYFRAVRGWDTDTEVPIFVLGMPRSGTTLVEQILASHPEVFGAGELGEMPRMMVGLARQAGQDARYAAPAPLPNRTVANDLAAGYLRRIQQHAGGASRVTVKTLENFMFLGVIAAMFPRAPVIYCRRDPLDTCLSCYFQNFEGNDFSWSLEDIATYYRQYERLMAHWRRVGPMPILEVHYEELIAQPERVTRKMLAFCGLDWHERCLSFFHNRRTVRTASTVQVRKPLSSKSIGRWKHYERYLGPLFQALGLSPGGKGLPADPRSQEPARPEPIRKTGAS